MRTAQCSKETTSREQKQLEGQVARAPKMSTIQITGGRKDKLRAGDILGALTGEAGSLSGANIGKIEIQERQTYVGVSVGVSRKVADSLNKGRIKGRRFRATLVARCGSR